MAVEWAELIESDFGSTSFTAYILLFFCFYEVILFVKIQNIKIRVEKKISVVK